MKTYREDLVNRYWNYQKVYFPRVEDYFDRPFAPDGRPPVFHKQLAWNNVLIHPDDNDEERKQRLLNLIPDGHRQKWFCSMNSSQALAQSVLGNLKVYDCLSYLGELTADSGESLLGDASVSPENFVMEFQVDYLGEPHCTSLDGFISGTYQVAIECKFTESEVGSCSRPLLKPRDSNYETDFCDGTFTKQRGRRERCSLTGIGVLYWRYVPELFKWSGNVDLVPCPLHKNYQLVRNVLAACVRPDGTLSPESGHVVLIYDERNPAFQENGHGFIAFEETRDALKDPCLLRKCSWQRIIRRLRIDKNFSWLTEQLEIKYGF